MDSCFENFRKYKKQGLEAYQRGDLISARADLLRAAEYLFILAQNSEPPLKESRKENAIGLKQMALQLSCRIQEQEKIELQPVSRITPPDPAISVAFTNIVGLEEVKQTILIRMVYPFRYEKLAQKYGIKKGGGILLYGPPGTGKTMIARAVANEIAAAFLTVKPSEIMSKLVGEAEKNMSELFNRARQAERAVIFIDEVDALVPARRDDCSSVMQRLVPQILQELEGVNSDKEQPLLFLGATNEPWALDPAIMRPGRFDELLYVPLPDREARKAIFAMNLADKPLATIDYYGLADATPGYSGADIKGICQRSANLVFLDAITQGNERTITMTDLQNIIAATPPSVSSELDKKIANFARR